MAIGSKTHSEADFVLPCALDCLTSAVAHRSGPDYTLVAGAAEYRLGRGGMAMLVVRSTVVAHQENIGVIYAAPRQPSHVPSARGLCNAPLFSVCSPDSRRSPVRARPPVG
jgi:hypothetical protein